jgi:hypothetical protein
MVFIAVGDERKRITRMVLPGGGDQALAGMIGRFAPAIVRVMGHTAGMTVYVDDAVHSWRGQRWAHLMADTLEELHAMAARLGIPRRAFQNKTSGAHYDVTADLRELAIALGAVAISRHHDRALVKAEIARAKAQGRGEAQ